MHTYTRADLNQTQVSIYNADSGKYSNQQRINKKSSYICRSRAQLPWTKLLLRSNNGPKFWVKRWCI